jgi:hypothetical protein
MKADDTKRLKDLERGNSALKRIVAVQLASQATYRLRRREWTSRVMFRTVAARARWCRTGRTIRRSQMPGDSVSQLLTDVLASHRWE